jgi:hypothetical protein
MRVFAVCLALSATLACGGPPREPEPVTAAVPPSTTTVAAAPSDDSMPAPVDVCLVSDQTRTRATSYPSRAGVYDPTAPIDPALLNWSLPNRGCVSPPLANTPRVPCPDDPPLPAVSVVLCGQ